MADFDEYDLLNTVRSIEKRWEDGETSALLLKELLTAFRHHEAHVHDEIAGVTERQHALEKSLILLATHAEKADRRHRALAKSLGRAVVGGLSKSRTFPAAADVTRVPAPPVSLADQAARGTLAKAVLVLFGPGSGHSLRYDGALASKLMLRGDITAREHNVWKKSGRLSDAAWARVQAG